MKLDLPAAEASISNREEIICQNSRPFSIPPDFVRSCSRRAVSTAPLQALYLLNSELMQRSASEFAARLERKETSRRAQVRLAGELLFGRELEQEEIETSLEFLESGSLKDFCLALMNTNEFFYIP